MLLAYLTFITGIAISLVAIYYSVLGLAAIFAAAVIPIVIMGTTLEVAKLVTAWWLKANWHRAPLSIKIYLLPAVIMLMIITSMGIFGFLSKAHTDQAVPLGDTAAQVAFIDEKINNEREIIANARSLIKQLDDAVIGIQSGEGREIRSKDGSVRIENPAERALQIRRAQAKDRAALTAQIEQAQAKIVKLQEEKAPIAGQLRAVEAEVGPIKYIAKLIYGDNPDQNILEKAVVWVIIIIVMVFDPLAVLLLLASQMSFQWARQDRHERTTGSDQNATQQEDGIQEVLDPVQRPAPDSRPPEDQKESDNTTEDHSEIEDANKKLAEIPKDVDIDGTIASIEEVKNTEASDLEKWNQMIAEAEKAAKEESESDDQEIIATATSETEKSAMKAWKQDHPNTSLKLQKSLLKRGKIDKLPWEDYLKPQSDFAENEAAEEAAKWAIEQLEESKKKDMITWMEKQGKEQIKRSIEK